jgi:hypothetical protein
MHDSRDSEASRIAARLWRHAIRRRRPLTLAVALLAASAVVQGLAGVLLAFTAVLLVLDTVLPTPGTPWSEADDRFRRQVRERRRRDRARRLRGLPPERLDVIDDSAGWAATAERRALGVQAIPVESITGTLEGDKARTFDRAFRPGSDSAEHWKRLWVAQAHGASLPPISVYRVGAAHVVRDGHHRVAVARDRGQATIDADVVELRRPVRVGHPGLLETA